MADTELVWTIGHSTKSAVEFLELLESSVHMAGLGGRRKPNPDSTNTIWRNAGFRGYADYMGELENLALHHRLAYLCAEPGGNVIGPFFQIT